MAEGKDYAEYERTILKPLPEDGMDTQEKPTSPEEFIITWPLHSPVRVPNFREPSKISFHCPGICAKETTWRKDADTQPIQDNTGRATMYSVSYSCSLCERSNLVVIWKKLTTEKITLKTPPVLGRIATPDSQVDITSKIMKIGQYPPLSIKVAKPLAKGLGEDALALYRKGLISRNSGFGLGAVAYIRRIVEDKTNELIEVAAQLAESQNVDALIVAQMRDAANTAIYTAYEEKLRIASTVYPDSLKVGSVNPLKVLYGLVSKGIHGLTEEACLEAFDQTLDIFDYIFTHISSQVADRRAFVERVKRIL